MFHGAFCFAILAGMPLQQVLDFSNAAAAINCTAIGARGHIPTRSEVVALLSSNSDGAGGRRMIRKSRSVVNRAILQRSAANR